jgi:dephospho-CoA kinase
MVLGLTGGIACGKSTVAGIFRELGAAVVSADALAREIVRPGSVVLAEIAAFFGDWVLDETGNLDRRGMAELIFADARARADLNRITHPAIARLAAGEFRKHQKAGARFIVYDAPLLFEAKAENQVDKVVVVTVDQAQQIARLMSRDGIGRQQALARLDAQMPQNEKAARADYLIDNSGSVEETRRQVRELLTLLERAPGEGIPNTPGCAE